MCDGRLDSVCRLCLRDNFSLKRIFHNPCFSNEPLSTIMEKIYDLKICEGDGLPSKICVPCLWKVLEFDTYRKNVRHAEEELRKFLSRTCDNSNEVSEEGTYNVADLTAEGEMDVADDPLEGIESDIEVCIKDEIDIVDWEMPQDMVPEEDILENVKSEAGEEVLKDTEVSNNDLIEIEERQQEEFQPEMDTSKNSNEVSEAGTYNGLTELTAEGEMVSVIIDLEHYYAAKNGETDELEESQSSESCDVNSSECLGQMDKDFENVSLISNSSVVSTSGISGKNNANEEMCEESVTNVLFTEKESLFSLRSKSGNNSAKSGSSSSRRSVQSKRKQFVCDLCNKSFPTKLNLGNHVRIHYDDRPYKCRECGRSFKQECAKIEHELRHLRKQMENGRDEKKSTKKSHVCEICNKEFSTRDSFYKHSNLHKNKYICTFCGKRCGSKYHLEQHLRMHSNEKPFSCEICKMRFNQKRILKSHIITHSDYCPFQCSVCDKRFKTKYRKNRHELYHLRSK